MLTGKEDKRRNIVFILSDDQGTWALGCAGNKELVSPNLNRLACEGILFSNFFCVSPVCSPARASILTGKIPSQHGIHDWLAAGSIDYGKLPEHIKKSQWLKDEKDIIEYLKGQTAYTDILANNGYSCGLCGKWHLGNSITPQIGFEYWKVIAAGGTEYRSPEIIAGGKVCQADRYITDIITDDAIEFLEKSEKDMRPFYLGVHYTAPHSPWNRENHPKEIWEMYNDCSFDSVPNLPLHPWIIDEFKHLADKKERKEALQGYYTAITAMDNSIGKIMQKLDEMGERDNTLIIFTSDNGMNMGHHGVFGKGNGTFPLNMYDSSVKVPMIISLPGKTSGGRICDELLSHYDIMPTLLEYLGIKYSGSGKLPGKSFFRVLNGTKTTGREDIVVFDEYGPVRMIRSKEWKYIHRYPYGPNELYDIKNDPDETVNLVYGCTKENILENLKEKLDNWFKKYVVPAKDGSNESVTGNGQINLSSFKGRGITAFKQL